ncbi:MAG: hypothetical protein PF638_02480 [Candidatus Delongbacteria bacterium]|jgi:hypothetical protein|nr:hypothetical protein [Candidatus Delongbacteria bacterium]
MLSKSFFSHNLKATIFLGLFLTLTLSYGSADISIEFDKNSVVTASTCNLKVKVRNNSALSYENMQVKLDSPDQVVIENSEQNIESLSPNSEIILDFRVTFEEGKSSQIYGYVNDLQNIGYPLSSTAYVLTYKESESLYELMTYKEYTEYYKDKLLEEYRTKAKIEDPDFVESETDIYNISSLATEIDDEICQKGDVLPEYEEYEFEVISPAVKYKLIMDRIEKNSKGSGKTVRISNHLKQELLDAGFDVNDIEVITN